MKALIVYINSRGKLLADIIAANMPDSTVIHHATLSAETMTHHDALIFICAMGICVRAITPIVNDKHTDPAVVCVDTAGRHVISVLSGHIGGANDLSRRVAAIIGADPVITTQSDGDNLWALDNLADKYGWILDADHETLNHAIALFVGGAPTALIVKSNDNGTRQLRQTMPPHVTLCHSIDAVTDDIRLVIAITPEILPRHKVTMLCYRPPVLSLGIGCRRMASSDGVADDIERTMIEGFSLSPLSIATIATINLKRDEPLLADLAQHFNRATTEIYTTADLRDIEVPNPSEKALEVTGIAGVAEACAMKASGAPRLLIEKQKRATFTFAVAARSGHIEIVGAGPGDPDLVSVRGRQLLQSADLILYAGSLVPVALTACAKPGATVRSSASMSLDEQFALMKDFYDRGCLVVRLHTGDPCIYGAIQEQMALFDSHNMSYHITPGISAFQAAAAELRSQFTIPERVQSIILTRDEGRTPLPSRESIARLAQSQSTMCIYLSADLVEHVQTELLTAYAPLTPVAVCYKLTWPEQRIYRGTLGQLSSLVRDNDLRLTTLIVVGDAIDNRRGLSRLYDKDFSHLFRK